MGLESFFVKVIPKNYGGNPAPNDVLLHKDIDILAIANTLDETNYKITMLKRNSEEVLLVLNDIVVFKAFKNNNIIDMWFEGVFAAYEECIDTMYKSAETINKSYKIFLSYPIDKMFDMDNISGIEFKNAIKSINLSKYNEYNVTFKNFSKRVNVANFYTEYSKTKSIFKRFFHFK